MASAGAYKRLNKEYLQLQKDPPEFAIAKPSERNILEWHYIITGPPDTPYHNGQYYGTLHFPADYPFKPPSIKMCTPSGRFQCNTRLCLSISDFHPKSWNPSWQVSTILTGLVSFMTSEEMTTGGLSTSHAARVMYARDSRASNLKNSTFVREFPEICEENRVHVAAQDAATQKLRETSGTKEMEGSAVQNLEHAQAQLQGTGGGVTKLLVGAGVLIVILVLGRLLGES
ncbi:ubiquitin-conjugating enzyme/RWD-like protein [Protomyces lactucae-debilis]|uniref:Ubiquitin-conjugating enzyme E2 6 n=1 Tax=Protomyces lactucae-debilis TaxID=2754530 RepID=A0A1Y2F2W9_PROLT|nr:ubiquitin-conjugating enzyme/RWD-like protein [Protomyces lactucae-debilis]ORY78219.1 ubiquitin-conjugating enzyme/RWD-like protein [Protomyces lactucae-debilis]